MSRVERLEKILNKTSGNPYHDSEGKFTFSPSSFKNTSGKDAEVTDNPRDWYLTDLSRKNINKVPEISSTKELKDYLSSNGIKSDIDNPSIKKHEDYENIKFDALKKQASGIVASVEFCKAVFGKESLSKLKEIKFYSSEAETTGSFDVMLKGEKPSKTNGTLELSTNITNRGILHEFIHVVQDSTKRKSQDCVLWSKEILDKTGVNSKAYTGANKNHLPAEQLADLISFGIANGKNLEDVSKVINYIKKNKTENSIQFNGGHGSGNHNPGQGWGAGKPGIGTKSGESIKWGGDVEFGTEHFIKHVKQEANNLENEYGISLGHTKIVKPNVMEHLYGISMSDKEGNTVLTGSSEIQVSFNDYTINNKPDESFSNYESFMSNSVTRTDGIGLIKHELGHAMVAELSQLAVKKFGKDKQGAEIDKAIRTLDISLNKALYAAGAIASQKANLNYKLSERKSTDKSKYNGMSSYGLTSEAEYVAESISNPNYSVATKTVSNKLKEIAKKVDSSNYDDINSFTKDVAILVANQRTNYLVLCSGYPKVNDEKLNNIFLVANGNKNSGNHNPGQGWGVGKPGSYSHINEKTYEKLTEQQYNQLNEDDINILSSYLSSPDSAGAFLNVASTTAGLLDKNDSVIIPESGKIDFLDGENLNTWGKSNLKDLEENARSTETQFDKEKQESINAIKDFLIKQEHVKNHAYADGDEKYESELNSGLEEKINKKVDENIDDYVNFKTGENYLPQDGFESKEWENTKELLDKANKLSTKAIATNNHLSAIKNNIDYINQTFNGTNLKAGILNNVKEISFKELSQMNDEDLNNASNIADSIFNEYTLNKDKTDGVIFYKNKEKCVKSYKLSESLGNITQMTNNQLNGEKNKRKIDEIIKNKGITLTEGIEVKRVIPKDASNFISKQTSNNGSYKQYGLMSTSAIGNVNQSAGKEMMAFGDSVITIDIPKGTKVLFMENIAKEKFADDKALAKQHEVILSSGTELVAGNEPNTYIVKTTKSKNNITNPIINNYFTPTAKDLRQIKLNQILNYGTSTGKVKTNSRIMRLCSLEKVTRNQRLNMLKFILNQGNPYHDKFGKFSSVDGASSSSSKLFYDAADYLGDESKSGDITKNIKSFKDFKNIVDTVKKDYNGGEIEGQEIWIHPESRLFKKLESPVTDENVVKQRKTEIENENKSPFILVSRYGGKDVIVDGNHVAASYRELSDEGKNYYVPILYVQKKEYERFERDNPNYHDKEKVYTVTKKIDER